MWFWNQLFAKKSLETLHAEMEGENRLRRVLGPINLTSLGIGAIIGAGIFVMTGRTAAADAGPAVIMSYVVAGIGCTLAALCYAEFASTVPVAGSAYTYAYATLGELFAWIIGWDLILEYAMACGVVASSWSKYLNKLLELVSNNTLSVPEVIASDPFSDPTKGALFNLPAVAIMLLVTVVLVIGIRESATTNAVLVITKVGVVLFVIVVGAFFVNPANWTSVPVTERLMPEEVLIPDMAEKVVKEQITKEGRIPKKEREERIKKLTDQAMADYTIERKRQEVADLQKQGQLTEADAKAALNTTLSKYEPNLPQTDEEKAKVQEVMERVKKEVPEKTLEKWGILGSMGLDRWLGNIDNSVRSPFAPYGLSGIMLGAAIVFFAYIGFDAISTHSEEARNPQRDVPIGILASLAICTVMYIAVSAVITGMQKYPTIDQNAAVASAFGDAAKAAANRGEASWMLTASGILIAIGGLAGMTSVLLITFLSQARIFLAMARDRLLPPGIFGAIHPKFRTPHISTMLTGAVICVVAAFTPIVDLENMVNIGTLMAFVIVCAAVLVLRVKRPDVHRPFRCPAVKILAPLGIVVNLTMMLFLPPITWLRLVGWLAVGLVIYFCYGLWNSTLGRNMRGLPTPAIAAAQEAKV
ncbi:MAG TPA: amino acid permease [Gemmataceae bacterium]|nr:amino acid permease [Gemmataceae bacterium]